MGGECAGRRVVEAVWQWCLSVISMPSREVRRRERTEKDAAESRGRAEALALELRERRQEAFLAEQRAQRVDAIAKEQRVRQPCPAPLPAEHWLDRCAAPGLHCRHELSGSVCQNPCALNQLTCTI